MARNYTLYQIDSFTKELFTGNPAGVVTDADGLTEAEMQRIARELNNSETAFIFQPDEPGYDVRVRFFTPGSEVPICGHATIAAHYARAMEEKLGTARVLQKTGAGILPVDIVWEKDDYSIVMTQGRIEFGPFIEGALLEELLAALRLRGEELLPHYPVQVVSTGHSKVMIGIQSRALLNRLAPDMEGLKTISKAIHCNGFFVFAMAGPDADFGPDILVCGRMFAPAIGIAEDPVTGNANGPLGAYLVQHRLVNHNGSSFCFNALQGEAMGRPGVICVDVAIQGGAPAQVKIAGNARLVFTAQLCL